MKYKLKGVITKITEYSDNDLILTIFTLENGKISVFAKGVRKSKSKESSVNNLFIFGEFELYKSKDWYKLTSVEIIESYYFIREDIEKLSYGSYFLELINTVTVAEKPDKEIFKLLVNSLNALKHYKSSLIKVVFEYKILKFSGFEPQIYDCSSCGAELNYNKIVLSIKNGGLLCEKCNDDSKENLNLSSKILKILRFFSKNNFEDIIGIEINDLFIEKLDIIFMKYISYYFEKSNFKSLKFLDIFKGGNINGY